MKPKTHKNLDVWQRSVLFVTAVYKLTQKFPQSEQYGLTSQIRRAAVSIPSNIAEGAARRTKPEFRRFLFIALGSTAELETQILISNNLNYLANADQEQLMEELNTISRMLQGLIKTIAA
jgi:four helix bundle protein